MRKVSGGTPRAKNDLGEVDEVRILNGTVVVVVNGEPIELRGSALRSVVTHLAMAVPGGVSTTDLIHNGGNSNSVHQLVRRLRNDYGIPIAQDAKVHGYALHVTRTRVDGLRLLDAADNPGSDDDQAVLSLWSDGPVRLSSTVAIRLHETLHIAKAKLEQRTAKPKQVLIVDDDQAEDVATRLRADGIQCVTASSIEEFRRLSDELSHFDLLVLDLHLTKERHDESGLKVADRIFELGSDIPILGMTFKVPQNRPYGELMGEYYDRGLLDLVSKRAEGLPDFQLLAERVRHYLNQPDKAASSIEQIRHRLPVWKKTAIAYLDYGKADAQTQRTFNLHFQELQKLVNEEDPDLGMIRSRYRRFRIDFLTAR